MQKRDYWAIGQSLQASPRIHKPQLGIHDRHHKNQTIAKSLDRLGRRHYRQAFDDCYLLFRSVVSKCRRLKSRLPQTSQCSCAQATRSEQHDLICRGDAKQPGRTLLGLGRTFGQHFVELLGDGRLLRVHLQEMDRDCCTLEPFQSPATKLDNARVSLSFITEESIQKGVVAILAV